MREFRGLVMNQTCACCGKRAEGLPHHKHPKSRAEVYDGDIHDPSNLVSTCMDCHAKWDAAMGQAPSPSASKRFSNGKNFERLNKRWQRNWKALAPDYILEAHADYFLAAANHKEMEE